MRELTDGLWWWTARHPEWHPRGFGDVVGCYAVTHGEGTLLIDPLLPVDADRTLAELDAIMRAPVAIMVTIPYHVRSARQLAERYDAEIWGHPAVLKRPIDPDRFREVVPGAALPGGASAFTIGSPRRYEMPLYLPSHRALVFGDALVVADGALRVWLQTTPKPSTEGWFQSRLRPSFEPLLNLDVDRVLVTHGEPVLADAMRALSEAIAGPPWFHGPS